VLTNFFSIAKLIVQLLVVVISVSKGMTIGKMPNAAIDVMKTTLKYHFDYLLTCLFTLRLPPFTGMVFICTEKMAYLHGMKLFAQSNIRVCFFTWFANAKVVFVSTLLVLVLESRCFVTVILESNFNILKTVLKFNLFEVRIFNVIKSTFLPIKMLSSVFILDTS